MGILKKFFEFLGFEDKESLRAQFDALYYENVEDEEEFKPLEEPEPEPVEEPEPEIVVDIDPVVADYERLIRMATDPAEKQDFENRLERYKRKKGI